MSRKDKSILIKNIYYILAYAMGATTWLEQRYFDAEQFENIHDLFALLLGHETSRLIKRGLYKEYIPHTESISTIRGTINIPQTIRNQIRHDNKICCTFDEFSEDNIFNQIIKTTALLLVRHKNVKPDKKARLKKLMLYFSGVQTIPAPDKINWDQIQFHRYNSSYKLLIPICRLILQSMLIRDTSGKYKLQDFLNAESMHRLYENFIFEYYKYHFGNAIEVARPHIPWKLDSDIDQDHLPTMKTDITLCDKTHNNMLIIDAKYYTRNTQVQFDKHTIHSHNLYQIFAYVKNQAFHTEWQNKTVSGMLLYAKTDTDIESQPNKTYPMSGNQISVKTLDLNVDFEEIKKQLDTIAKTITKDK